MRSPKTVISAAVLTTGLLLGAPAAAQAAAAPQDHSTACRTAVGAALKAEAAYNAAAADLKKQIAAGGHPGTAEESNVANLLTEANSLASTAARVCGHVGPRPHGGMHTGTGSTSQGIAAGETAAGLGLLGAAGAGALALRRRRTGTEA
ncbi:MAG: hypothetical protein HOW97_31085 [Catenulispora sp.]|nr:hypothetical protein [Catenulispora sp.]